MDILGTSLVLLTLGPSRHSVSALIRDAYQSYAQKSSPQLNAPSTSQQVLGTVDAEKIEAMNTYMIHFRITDSWLSLSGIERPQLETATHFVHMPASLDSHVQFVFPNQVSIGYCNFLRPEHLVYHSNPCPTWPRYSDGINDEYQ